MRKLLTKLVGDPHTKPLKNLRRTVETVNRLEPTLKKQSLAQLKAQTGQFKKLLSQGKSLDDILPEAFALVREVARRTLGQRHFDVQLIGGMVLHEAKIAEMRTGEGKTLVATLPVYLNALEGQGVHVVTVNDFLAQRDAGWMGGIYDALGLSLGIITSGNRSFIYDPEFTNPEHADERLQHLRPVPKKEAYAADITYGTNNEFGFDYLRDNMTSSLDNYVQREQAYAIVDEVDSILIDEARTPLIISAAAGENATNYEQFALVARQLKPEQDCVVDEKSQSATLTDAGVAKVEKLLGIENLYAVEHVQSIYHIEQSLRAEVLFRRDKDYVVREGEVIIVDEFTGRLLPGRRYSEGLHQAIEAKEGVEILQESSTLATISFQNYFRLYQKLAGMTGTAVTEAEEFQTVYNLDVVAVPPDKVSVRADLSDRIYKTETAKFKAIVNDVKERHQRGQPVLIGTVSIEKNELLAQMLTRLKVPHSILNAKNNEREAAIIASAGQKGTVTLATNIAGRGTDIVLGKGVVEQGGLHVLGSERHEARRIDNQLRGRSGRQGDPGSTQFYVSLEDDLMRIFGGQKIAGLMTTLRVDEDTPIENKLINRALEGAQKRIESHNFDIRKQVLQYDDVMNRHRQSTYARRRQILENKTLRPEILKILERETDVITAAHRDARTDTLQRDKILATITSIAPLSPATVKNLEQVGEANLQSEITQALEKLYAQRESEFGAETMRLVERLVYLQILDQLWMQHLETMGHLREGIRLQAIGQRDPLVEYKKQSFQLFNELNQAVDREVASTIFKVAPAEQPSLDEVETELTRSAAGATFAAGSGTKSAAKGAPSPLRKQAYKIGRNDPCPCGSGLKYKKCGLINAPEHRA